MQVDGWCWGAGAARACCPPDSSMEPPWPLASPGQGHPVGWSWCFAVPILPGLPGIGKETLTIWPIGYPDGKYQVWNPELHLLHLFPGSNRENCICKYFSIYVNIFFHLLQVYCNFRMHIRVDRRGYSNQRNSVILGFPREKISKQRTWAMILLAITCEGHSCPGQN